MCSFLKNRSKVLTDWRNWVFADCRQEVAGADGARSVLGLVLTLQTMEVKLQPSSFLQHFTPLTETKLEINLMLTDNSFSQFDDACWQLVSL